MELILDEEALDRIINAVGLPVVTDRNMLRFGLLTALGHHAIAVGPGPQSKRLGSMRKHAVKLIELLRADEADYALIRAVWPVSPDRQCPHVFTQLVFLVELIDLLTAFEARQGQSSASSPLKRLVGEWLAETYERHFGRLPGRSRAEMGGAPYGPYVRFVLAVLGAAGIKCSAETVAKYTDP
jgi:hypothetical protein